MKTLSSPGCRLLSLVRMPRAHRGRDVVELSARARLGGGGELVLPDDVSAIELAGKRDLVEIFGAPVKLKADLLLSGAAHAPGGEPVPSLTVRLSVGAHRRELLVLGDRGWDAANRRPSEPLPFATMPLVYERAFGGPAYADNPLGCGHVPAGAPPPKRLPNILDPRDAEQGTIGRAPAGFAPQSRAWGRRRALGGSYDERWLAERWPDDPDDLDPAYFNAAPPELQVPFLRGDEAIVLENLHPREPLLRARLPGLRPRCFLRDGAGFEEVGLSLDTLWIDVPMELVTLVWRGSFAPPADEAESCLYLVREALADPPLAALRHAEELAALLAVETPELVDIAEAPTANDNEAQAGVDEALAASLAGIRELMVKGGASEGMLQALASGDPDRLAQQLLAESGASQAQAEAAVAQAEAAARALFARHGFDPAAAEPVAEPPEKLTREDVVARHQAGESLAEQDLAGLDLSGLDLSGARLAGAILAGASLKAARLRGADLARAVLTGADLSAAGLAEACLADADLTGAQLTGADLGAADLCGAVLRDANLERATLQRARAVRAVFEGAALGHASLHEADLTEASLAGCELEQTSFHRADLTRAVLERARGTGVDLSAANLTYLKAGEGAQLPKANLRGARGRRAVWFGADLRAADLSLADLGGADLSGADLEGADLHGADLRGANLDRARLLRARATRANFFEASFIEAQLEEADFRGASLYGAELLRSRRQGARFDGALLDRTKLAADAPRLPPGV